MIAGFTDSQEAAWVQAQVERVKALEADTKPAPPAGRGSDVFDDIPSLTWERFRAEMNGTFPGQPESHWREVFEGIKARVQ